MLWVGRPRLLAGISIGFAVLNFNVVLRGVGDSLSLKSYLRVDPKLHFFSKRSLGKSRQRNLGIPAIGSWASQV